MNIEYVSSLSQLQKDACENSISRAVTLLKVRLGDNTEKIINQLTIKVGNDLIESGAQTFAEKNLIIFDADKNKLSLLDAEKLLVSYGVLDKGDWTKLLKENIDLPWSCLTYQFIHEVGHIIDGQVKDGKEYNRVIASQSPTLYGKTSPSEAFAEMFTYWILGYNQTSETEKKFMALIDSTWEKFKSEC